MEAAEAARGNSYVDTNPRFYSIQPSLDQSAEQTSSRVARSVYSREKMERFEYSNFKTDDSRDRSNRSIRRRLVRTRSRQRCNEEGGGRFRFCRPAGSGSWTDHGHEWHMRARGKDGIEPGGWFARQQTVRHRQFLPPRLEDLRQTERRIFTRVQRPGTVTSRLPAGFPVRVVSVRCARGDLAGRG